MQNTTHGESTASARSCPCSPCPVVGPPPMKAGEEAAANSQPSDEATTPHPPRADGQLFGDDPEPTAALCRLADLEKIIAALVGTVCSYLPRQLQPWQPLSEPPLRRSRSDHRGLVVFSWRDYVETHKGTAYHLSSLPSYSTFPPASVERLVF